MHVSVKSVIFIFLTLASFFHRLSLSLSLGFLSSQGEKDGVRIGVKNRQGDRLRARNSGDGKEETASRDNFYRVSGGEVAGRR